MSLGIVFFFFFLILVIFNAKIEASSIGIEPKIYLICKQPKGFLVL